jgi:hypothetical protein
MSLLAVLQDFVEHQAARAADKGANQSAILVVRHAANRNADPGASADGDCRALH